MSEPSKSTVFVGYLIYGLHGFSAINGLLSPAFIVTAFLTGWPSILALILTYLKRSDASNTYLESHYQWLLSTFWWSFVWICVSGVLFATFIGIPFAYLLLIITGVWVLYRLYHGGVRLLDTRGVDL
jgi:uncharacterized membrane protein